MPSSARVFRSLRVIKERSSNLPSGMKLSTELVSDEHRVVAEELRDRSEARGVSAFNGLRLKDQRCEHRPTTAVLLGVHSFGVGAARVLVGVLIVAFHSGDDGSLPPTR